MKALMLLGILTSASAAAEKEISLRSLKIDSPEFREAQAILSLNAMVGSRQVKITQHVGGDLYLAESGVERYAIEIPSKHRLHDGHKDDYWLRDSGKVFEYTSVLGAKITVKQYRAAEPPAGDLSPEKLIARAKAGEVFRFKKGSTQQKCKACGGLGTVRSEKAGQNRSDCPSCEKGFAKVPQVWVVRW